jgi:hypothetical protein
MSRSFQWLQLGRLVIASFFLQASPVAADDKSWVSAIEARPSYGWLNKTDIETDEVVSTWTDIPPVDLKQEVIYYTGDDPNSDTSVNISRRLYIGCFEADLAITTFTRQGRSWNPNECLDECMKKFVNDTTYQMIVAVHELRCACVVGDITTFKEVDSSLCDIGCYPYLNPLCGGAPNYWGVFMEYSHQSQSAQGAYDPRRYLWFSIVVMQESRIQGGYPAESDDTGNIINLERYYVHAVDTQSGLARYEYQLRLPGILYGIQYDIDSTRLVGLFTEQDTGRVRVDAEWQYKLVTIRINTTFASEPQMVPNYNIPLAIVEKVAASAEYLAYQPATAIMSQLDCFIFTQVQEAGFAYEMKERLYVVEIDSGFILRDEELDFKVLQMFGNEKYGDITAIGPRYPRESGQTEGQHSYIHICRIARSPLDNEIIVNWMFEDVFDPQLLLSVESTSNWTLYPGVGASEHRYNKSAIMHSYVPPENSDFWRTIAITEVNIHDREATTHWCTPRMISTAIEDEEIPCQGTVRDDIPYMSIYTKEPGIPLTLRSPRMTRAWFSLDASKVTVDWSDSTLKGALYIDVNQDGVPDMPDDINYSTVPDGNFDCGLVFTKATTGLIGLFFEDDIEIGTYCLWKSRSQIEIFLPNILNISVGDDLFVKVDTIYREPLDGPNGREYSPAATDGISVDLPDDLRPPLIVPQGSTDLDECSDLKIDIANSKYLGGDWWVEIEWYMVNSTYDDPNPRDLTNTEGRVYDPVKNESLYQLLAEATLNSSRVLIIPSPIMESAYAYRIEIRMTSRWRLTSSKVITINKADYTKPQINLLQTSPMERYSTERFSLQAECTVSPCASEDAALAYRWSSDPIQDEITGGPDAEASALVIPAGTLMPSQDELETYAIYNFTVSCYVDTPEGNIPEKTARSTISVWIKRSAISVQFRSDGRYVTKGEDIIVIDVRESQDPDFPTPPGSTFRGTFRFWCFTPPPARAPCFGGSTGEIIDADTCRKDTSKFVEGGVTFEKPIFDQRDYCQFWRGVMMFNTQNFELGEYKFDVEITDFSGLRTDKKSVLYTLTNEDVPRYILEILNPQERYAINKVIRIMASMEMQEGEVRNSSITRTFYWTIQELTDNPAYDRDAAANANDPNNPYTVDEFTWLEAQANSKIDNPDHFIKSPSQPNLIILPNTLMSNKTYRIMMEFTPPDVTPRPFSVVQMITAAAPPRGGGLTVEPMVATADTPRLMTADGWKGDTPSLAYRFGYVSYAAGEPVYNAFTTSEIPTLTYQIDKLPAGDRFQNYSLVMYVDVIADQYGALTRFVLGDDETSPQSLPPTNLTSAVLDGLADAENADPAAMTSELSYLMSLDPENSDLSDQVLGLYTSNSDRLPQTPGAQEKSALLLQDIVDGGNRGDAVLAAVEDLTISAVNTGSFTVNEEEEGGKMADIMFNIVGNLFPDDEMEEFRRTRRLRATDGEPDASSNNKRDAGTTLPNVDRRLESSSRNQSSQRKKLVPLTACPGRSCNESGQECVVGIAAKERYICCDAENSMTKCANPPCWFHGIRCPKLPPQLKMSRKLKAQSRRLNTLGEDRLPSKTLMEYTTVIEDKEGPMLEVTKELVAERDRTEAQKYRAESQDQISFQTMLPAVAQRLQAEYEQRLKDEAAYQTELERNKSQRNVRLVVIRDLMSKQLIRQLLQNEAPKEYTSQRKGGKRLATTKLGRTTDMSRVVDDFTFPSLFRVPFDSPIEPTPGNPVTGFAFIYTDWGINLFSWSESTPPSPTYLLVTLVVMKANTDDMPFRQIPDNHTPIRMFANKEILSNAVCMYWDRFSPGSPGGAWSRQGITNDAQGCITSHLSDVGLFVDGTVYDASPMVEAGIYYERSGKLTTCINCEGEYNIAVVAMLGIIVFVCTLMIMLGFVMDETTRTGYVKAGVKSRYLLGGDGITAALHVNDPIAYAYAGEKPIRLVMFTVWNMVKREHALISPLFYNELFTRPQRLQCLLSLLSGLLAFNAMVHSSAGSKDSQFFESREWFVPGVLSGLVLYPLYCGFLLMFNLRPKAVKRRLIKTGANIKEVEQLRNMRDKVAAETALMPKSQGVFPKNPPPHTMTNSSWPGATTMLNMAAPLPLPPLPPGVAGGTLGITGHMAMQGMPPGAGAQPGGLAGMGGMLALPTLPGRGAGSPLPPPPVYPPPPQDAKRLPDPGLPPNIFPKAGPPPAPYPELPALATSPNAALQDGSLGGTNRPGIFGAFDLPPLAGPVADTGATPQLADGRPQPSHQSLATTSEFGDTMSASQPPGVLQDDPVHQMMVDGGTPAGGTPTPSGPATPLGPDGSGFPNLVKDSGGADASPVPSGPATPLGQDVANTINSASDRLAGFMATGGTRATTPPNTPPLGASIRFPPQHAMVPQGDGPMPLFVRAQPPPMMPAPFAPAPQGPCGALMWKMPAMPPSGMLAPIPSAGGQNPASLNIPNVPPPPPPPPREQDQQFVRRIKYTYLDKVVREHQKFEMLEDPDELGPPTPGWVYDLMTALPYLACVTSTLLGLFIALQYGIKFQKWQENYYLYGTLAGMVTDLSVMEIFRMMMLTLVELRKYENRKRAKAGNFLPRRVPKEGFKGQIAPQPQLFKRATAKPPVPKGPKILPMPKIPPPPGTGPGGGGIGPVGPGGNPLAPPLPPPPPKSAGFSSAAMGFASMGGLGPPQLPPSQRSYSPRSTNASNRFEQTPPRSRGTSPRHGNVSPANSLKGMQQSLNTVVQNGAGRHSTQPPKPQASRSPSSGSQPPPPDGGPKFSRPTSANSGGSQARRLAAAKKAPTPP